MPEEKEIILRPGESSEVIERKNNHSILIGVVEGEGEVIQLDLRNSKKKDVRREIKIAKNNVVNRIQGDRFQIIASPNSGFPLTVIIEQKML